MRFYQVHRTQESGSSAGYEYFSTKREAEKAAAAWIKENPDERADIRPIEIEPTKAGILRALNQYAGHEDNG